MFETICAKSWMVKHIRTLFRSRPYEARAKTWACVVRNGHLMVVHRFAKRSGDCEVMWRLLRAHESPSWFATNWVVRRHWPVLKPIALQGWREARDRLEQQFWGSFSVGS